MTRPSGVDPRLTRLAASLPTTVPFVGPEAQERALGRRFDARLGANESVFGPSPAARIALENAASTAWMYGDPEAHDLTDALAAHHRIAAAHIKVGEGIDGLLGWLVRLTIAPGDVAVTSAGAYPTFGYHVAGFGGRLETVSYRKDAEDPDALLARAIETGAKLIYLANPDNPMGSWHSADRVQATIEAVPEGALLVLDEAYGDCAPDGTLPPLAPEDSRVIRFRTFSKIYGLAGARIGYAIGPAQLISAFDRVRNHFGVSRPAQDAALAALQDCGWLDEVRGRIAISRTLISGIAAANGLHALPSATNFVAVDCGRDGIYAARVRDALARRGVFVRMPLVAPENRCIRISCGRDSDMALLAAALPLALGEAEG